MDESLNAYLAKLEKYLKPLSVSERNDIIMEIKSEMMELSSNGISPGETIERLGDPKQLAKGYLGEAILNCKTFGLKRFGLCFAFYGLSGIGWAILFPVMIVISISFMLSGVISPVAGLAKFIGHLAGYDMPFISFQIASYTLDPIASLPVSILFGVIFFLIGFLILKATTWLIKALNRSGKRLKNAD
ncbi:MAG: DUF1700 domain-containing protein [Bacillota bacterium]|nr:DUF1700 domain-containing protein [Bacillota bacterium]